LNNNSETTPPPYSHPHPHPHRIYNNSHPHQHQQQYHHQNHHNNNNYQHNYQHHQQYHHNHHDIQQHHNNNNNNNDNNKDKLVVMDDLKVDSAFYLPSHHRIYNNNHQQQYHHNHHNHHDNNINNQQHRPVVCNNNNNNHQQQQYHNHHNNQSANLFAISQRVRTDEWRDPHDYHHHWYYAEMESQLFRSATLKDNIQRTTIVLKNFFQQNNWKHAKHGRKNFLQIMHDCKEWHKKQNECFYANCMVPFYGKIHKGVSLILIINDVFGEFLKNYSFGLYDVFKTFSIYVVGVKIYFKAYDNLGFKYIDCASKLFVGSKEEIRGKYGDKKDIVNIYRNGSAFDAASHQLTIIRGVAGIHSRIGSLLYKEPFKSLTLQQFHAEIPNIFINDAKVIKNEINTKQLKTLDIKILIPFSEINKAPQATGEQFRRAEKEAVALFKPWAKVIKYLLIDAWIVGKDDQKNFEMSCGTTKCGNNCGTPETDYKANRIHVFFNMRLKGLDFIQRFCHEDAKAFEKLAQEREADSFSLFRHIRIEIPHVASRCTAGKIKQLKQDKTQYYGNKIKRFVGDRGRREGNNNYNNNNIHRHGGVANDYGGGHRGIEGNNNNMKISFI